MDFDKIHGFDKLVNYESLIHSFDELRNGLVLKLCMCIWMSNSGGINRCMLALVKWTCAT